MAKGAKTRNSLAVLVPGAGVTVDRLQLTAVSKTPVVTAVNVENRVVFIMDWSIGMKLKVNFLFAFLKLIPLVA